MFLKDLHLNESNPRQIKGEKFEKLKKSVKEFERMLELRPIVVDENNVILGGNMRYRALEALGYSEIPNEWVKRAEGLTEEQKREFLIKDNVGYGEWDFDTLFNEWDTELLKDWGVDLPVMDADFGNNREVEEDDFDEQSEQVEERCKNSEVWQLGKHRLMCGDSTKAEDVEKLMGGEKADLLLTDPPYGVSYAEKNKFLNALGKPMSCPKRIENDDKSPQDMYVFWKNAFSKAFDFTKERMAYYITAPQGGDLLLLLLLQAVRDSGFMLKHQLVWNKNNHVLGRCDYNYKHEPIIYGWKINGTHSFYGGGDFKVSVWDFPKPQQSKLHPTMKPVALFANCIKDTTKENDVVLDLFGGSGTTLIACEQLNRVCRMMELDPHYCDVIIARWEKLTGQTAYKL